MEEIGTLCLTQVAARVRIQKRTLYNMINDGRFDVAPIPRTRPRRWSIVAVDAWIASQ